jgi:RNA binding exosome subunit
LTSPIQSLEVSYLVHSTEDEDRIGSAVESMLGIKVAPTREELAGHFGNRIVHVSCRLTGEAASSAFAGLARRLSPSAKKELVESLGETVDEHSTLYIRLDRQSLVKAELAFGGGEPVRVRVKPRLFQMKGRASEFFRRMLEGAV